MIQLVTKVLILGQSLACISSSRSSFFTGIHFFSISRAISQSYLISISISQRVIIKGGFLHTALYVRFIMHLTPDITKFPNAIGTGKEMQHWLPAPACVAHTYNNTTHLNMKFLSRIRWDTGNSAFYFFRQTWNINATDTCATNFGNSVNLMPMFLAIHLTYILYSHLTKCLRLHSTAYVQY